jgi:adenylate cyclase
MLKAAMSFKRFFLFTVSVFITMYGTAQSNVADSLRKVLAVSKNDTNKVTLLLALSKNSLNQVPETALMYANDAHNLAAELKFTRGKALALKSIGMVYYNQSKYPETLDYWIQSLNAFDSSGDKAGVSNMLSNIGAVYSNQTEDSKALEYYFKALPYAEQLNDKLRVATLYINIGNVYYHNPVNHNKALEYFIKALPITEELEDNNTLGSVTANIGEIYLDKNQFDSALFYFQKSKKSLDNSEDEAYALNNLGRFYTKKGNYEEAIRYHKSAFDTAQKIDGTLYMAQSILYLGDAYYKKGDYKQAIETYNSAVFYALKISDKNIELKNAYAGLSLSYAQQKDFTNAYKYNVLLSQVKDTLYNIDLDKKMAGYQTSFDLYKKQEQIKSLETEQKLQESDLNRQKTVKNALIAGLVLVSVIIVIIYRDYRNKIKTNKILDNQKAEIEHLLLNILPEEVADELQKTGTATPKYYDKATVLFTDFKSFSKLADDMSPQDVVSELNDCFIAFDDIIDKYKLEKIKTIGDAYMCAGGIPTEDDGHVVRIIKASLEIQQWMLSRNKVREQMSLPAWEMRIGINTGPIVAGVVGKRKYAYDIWGSAVNVASRMESNGEPGRVNISAATHELVKHKFACTYRGKIFAKNIGEIDMFFVDREIDEA